MAKILLLNAGSSSVKWKLYQTDPAQAVASGEVERINTPQASVTVKVAGTKTETTHPNLDYSAAARMIVTTLNEQNLVQPGELAAVGHRVVAGGQKFTHATKVDAAVLQEIKALASFAPLHNPQEARCIELMQKLLPDVDQYAVFDSHFFTQMPEVNAYYGLPLPLTEKYGVRRYGEHGISHAYLTKKAAQLMHRPASELKLITLHLGSGSSLCAIKNGAAFDSSMGFTPLTGVLMGTRAGDVDPSLVPFLMKQLAMTADEVVQMLNDKSGLLGVSQVSADMRDLEKAKQAGNAAAQLAYDMFINRVVKYVGSYYTEMNGADALIFAGGIGEHQTQVRADICRQLQVLGVELDTQKNEANQPGLLSPATSSPQVWLIPTDEEQFMFDEITAAL